MVPSSHDNLAVIKMILTFFCLIFNTTEETVSDSHPAFGSVPYIARPHPEQKGHTGEGTKQSRLPVQFLSSHTDFFPLHFSISGEAEEDCKLALLYLRHGYSFVLQIINAINSVKCFFFVLYF